MSNWEVHTWLSWGMSAFVIVIFALGRNAIFAIYPRKIFLANPPILKVSQVVKFTSDIRAVVF